MERTRRSEMRRRRNKKTRSAQVRARRERSARIYEGGGGRGGGQEKSEGDGARLVSNSVRWQKSTLRLDLPPQKKPRRSSAARARKRRLEGKASRGRERKGDAGATEEDRRGEEGEEKFSREQTERVRTGAIYLCIPPRSCESCRLVRFPFILLRFCGFAR